MSNEEQGDVFREVREVYEDNFSKSIYLSSEWWEDQIHQCRMIERNEAIAKLEALLKSAMGQLEVIKNILPN